MILCQGEITDINLLTIQPTGLINFNTEDQEKSSVTVVKSKDTLLIVVLRNHPLEASGWVNSNSNTLSRDLVVLGRWKQMKKKNSR